MRPCPNCGRPNPETNRFCEYCGATMQVAQAVPAPAAPPPPVHRTHWTLILGMVGALVVVLTVAGIGWAVFAARPVKVGAVVGVSSPSPTPTATATDSATDTPTPSPIPSPSPKAAFSTTTFALDQHAWKVSSSNDVNVILVSPDGYGKLLVASDVQSNPGDPDQLKQGIITALTGKYPDAKECGTPRTTFVGDLDGDLFRVCYTFTPDGGQATPGVSEIWVSSDGPGTTYYLTMVTAIPDYIDAESSGARDIIASIQWKKS